jgi:hypothetical protein
MKSEEVLSVVLELNHNMFEINDEENYWFEFTSTGDVDAVDFLGIQLWNSEDDPRKVVRELRVNEPGEDYEPLDIYLRREVRELAKNILKSIPE